MMTCAYTEETLRFYGPRGIHDWMPNHSVILRPTKQSPSKTAILIIAPPSLGLSDTESRWKLGKKVWEQYMNTNPNVDCYFIQYTSLKDKRNLEEVWQEGNTIYVADSWYENNKTDRILHKTIAAIEYLLPNYTHFIRTNLNSFLNLQTVYYYTKCHHQSMYTGPLWQGEWYVLGYGILFSADVATHITNEYRRLEGLDIVSHRRADDCVLTSLATGVYPLGPSEHLFSGCPTLPLGKRQLMSNDSLLYTRLSRYGALLMPPISLEEAIQYCENGGDSIMLYRIRHGLTLEELANFYQYLLDKIYRDLPTIDLVEYAKSLTET
jgi:hypothetical protein